MKKLPWYKQTKGFTLIELLIVIALLGALAIGLIGALDPFEQLKKGTDTGVRNTVSEFQQAVIRYYALKGYMPWCTDSNCSPYDPTNITAGASLANILSGSSVISRIVSTGELKSNFTTLQSAQLGKVFVQGSSTGVVVCYIPESKAFKADKNTKYTTLTGAEDGTNSCKSNGGASETCYWCVQ